MTLVMLGQQYDGTSDAFHTTVPDRCSRMVHASSITFQAL